MNLKLPDKSKINKDVINLTTVFNSVLDKHAPMRPMSRKKKDQRINLGLQVVYLPLLKQKIDFIKNTLKTKMTTQIILNENFIKGIYTN